VLQHCHSILVLHASCFCIQAPCNNCNQKDILWSLILVPSLLVCVSLLFLEFQEITFVCLLSACSHAGFWWIKACTGMLESVHFTGFLQNWNTTPFGQPSWPCWSST
jgi:hypothetical protein